MSESKYLEYLLRENIIPSELISEYLSYYYNNPKLYNESNWEMLNVNPNLTEELYNQYKDKFSLDKLTFDMSEEFIDENISKLNWHIISYFRKDLSIEFLTKYEEKIQWEIFSKNPNLTEEIVSEFKNLMNLGLVTDVIVSNPVKFSEEFLTENISQLDMHKLMFSNCLSDNFIQDNAENLNDRDMLIYAKMNRDD